jgi:hypothetical protein
MLQAFSGMISTIGDPDGAYARVNRRAVRCYTSNGYAPISNHGKYAGNPHAVCLYTRRGWQLRYRLECSESGRLGFAVDMPQPAAYKRTYAPDARGRRTTYRHASFACSTNA